MCVSGGCSVTFNSSFVAEQVSPWLFVVGIYIIDGGCRGETALFAAVVNFVNIAGVESLCQLCSWSSFNGAPMYMWQWKEGPIAPAPIG